MATDILDNVKRFRNQTSGMTRAQQIQWFGSKLGVGETQLLQLIGYSPTLIARQKAKGATFTELAEAKPERTVWVSELLFELADRSGYDLASLSTRLKSEGRETPTTGGTGIKTGGKQSAKKASPRTTAGILKKITLGGPDVLDLLTEYLSAARTIKGSDR